MLLAFVLVAGVGGVLTAGLVLPGVALANTATELSRTAFDDLPTELEQKPLSEKSTVLAADGTVLATFYSENRVVVPLEEVSEYMQQAVVAIEDKRFYDHAGVDPTGMLRAAVKGALSSGGVQEGASTLTQQYVKNVLIAAALEETDPVKQQEAINAAREAEGADGIARKLREAKLAIALEKTMTKQEILEKYLNIAQFGVSVYGIESASQYYFGKPASELGYLGAATLAGVTQSPTKWDPERNPEDSETRRNIVLRQMYLQDYISKDQYEKGRAIPLADTLKIQETKLGCMSATDVIRGSGYFCDYVTKVIANDEAFGETRTERLALLYRGGLTITTTLVPSEQRAADKSVKTGIPTKDASGVASSIVVVQPKSGKITAMAQNRTYNNTDDTTKYETAVNFNTDFAYGAASGFPPGSTFKPFTLLQWLKDGNSLNQVIDGRLKRLNKADFQICGSPGPFEEWEPGNAEGNGGFMSVLDATKNSVNSAYLAMGEQVDLCDVMDGASELGIHKPGGNGGEGGFDPLPANIIGSNSVAPLTMAAAFATFASGGIYCEPIAITKVTDADGEELPIPSADCHRAIEQRYANAMNYALSNVWNGTASSVGAPPFASAGKTGTTSRNEHTWFVGYTPLRAAAVWVGYPNAMKPVQNLTINGQWINYTYGSTIAAPTWKRFMVDTLEGKDNPEFGKADNKEIYGTPVQVPSVIGQDENTARDILQKAGFRVTVDEKRVDSTQPEGRVESQSVSGMAVKGSWITVVLSNGNAPQQPDEDDDDDGNGNGRGDDGDRGGFGRVFDPPGNND